MTRTAPRPPIIDPLPPDPALAETLRATNRPAQPRPAPRRVASHVAEHNRHRDSLALQLGGKREKRTPYGRADVATETTVFEVEPRSTWQTGVQQALAYSAGLGLRPALAVYGVIHRLELLDLYMYISATTLPALRSATSLELWWWTGAHWQHISARSHCVNMPWRTTFTRCPYCGQRIVWLSDGAPARMCYDYEHETLGDTHHCDALCTAKHRGNRDCLQWLARLAFPDSPARRHLS